MIKDQGTEQSNLGSFLTNVTPIVRSQFLPKGEIKNLNSLWNPWERETVEYFRLSDLWHCYDEWSAYGAGVPVVLGTGETVVQYYVPYLSAIQIFTSSSYVNSLREEFELRSYDPRDSFSDSFSDESESEKLWRTDGSSSEDGGSEHENLWNDRLGYLYFQYFEKSAPYVRVPLTDKINELSRRYPGLKLLRSVDLSPASWMAVAWYPIYHIPMGRTIKDLSTCFLTYHTLSSSFQDMDLEDEMEYGQSLRKEKEGEGVALPPFGLATYKLQGNVWVSGNGGQGQERLMSLLRVADSWLKQLRVQHHDFDYFMRSRRG